MEEEEREAGGRREGAQGQVEEQKQEAEEGGGDTGRIHTHMMCDLLFGSIPVCLWLILVQSVGYP